MLKDKIKNWSQNNHLPAQLDVVMGMAIMDAQKLEEKKRNQMTEADFFTAKD